MVSFLDVFNLPCESKGFPLHEFTTFTMIVSLSEVSEHIFFVICPSSVLHAASYALSRRLQNKEVQSSGDMKETVFERISVINVIFLSENDMQLHLKFHCQIPLQVC